MSDTSEEITGLYLEYAVDHWMNERSTIYHPGPPYDPRVQHWCRLVEDSVGCIIYGQRDETHKPLITCTLYLEIKTYPRVHLKPLDIAPAATALLPHIPPRLHISPRAILRVETFHEECLGSDLPDWVHKASLFDATNDYAAHKIEPFGFAYHLYTALATTDDNILQGYSPAMLRWASEVSPVRLARKAVQERTKGLRTSGNGSGLRRSVRVQEREREREA